jgi:predicted amidohydrolase
MPSIKIGIVQESPVFLNKEKSFQKALELIDLAAKKKCQLVTFGESWFSGYPAWIDHARDFAQWNQEAAKELFLRFYTNAISIDGKEIQQLRKTAKSHAMDLVIGINEKVNSGSGNGTVYNTVLTIGSNGEILNHHRKMMPTYTEKLLYGLGDALGLNTVSRSYGKLSSLICWEHWMPEARQALHLEGEHIHVALWPSVHEMHQICSRHYAFEGRCFVIAVGQMLKAKELPSELEYSEDLSADRDQWVLNGGSCIIGPDGSYLMPPKFNTGGLLTCVIENLDTVIKERMTLDASGHYRRPDIFELTINKKRHT